jgi:hypothetical protein
MGDQIVSSERNKIFKYLDLVNHIFYFSNLDDYLYKNPDTGLNKFKDSLDYFGEMLKFSDFVEKNISVIFTNCNFLQQNIDEDIGLFEISSLGFHGSYNYDNVVKFYKLAFKNVANDVDKNISFYLLNSLDMDSCKKFLFDFLQKNINLF